MLRNRDALKAIVRGLAHLAGEKQPDVIVGIESRGFALGPAVAVTLGVGFSPIRKDGSLFPGDVVEQLTEPDYRGSQRTLLARRDQFEYSQRVVLVDDWIETGSQAIATAQLIASCGAELVASVVIIDEASDSARSKLPPIRALLTSAELTF